MRRLHLLITMFLLSSVSFVFSQALMDYVDEVRGDTLVVKDYWDLEEQNSLYQVMALDTIDVPAGRVYMLKTAGYYPLVNNPTTQRPTTIVGEDNTILVNNDDAAAIPPLICGAAWDGGANNGALNMNHDFTLKNCNVVPGTANLGLGWSFFGASANVNVVFENCLFERTRWVFTNTNGGGISWHISNSYFVNLSGQPCRRNGGVLDCFAPQGTLVVENCTHVMAQGLVYKFRANPFDRIIMNHNTFVNMSNIILLDLGSQSAMSVTNNLFVNCQTQPYGPVNLDVGEEDIDKLPMGLVNVYPDTAVHIDRKIYVDNNAVYWDASLADLVTTANTNMVNNDDNWTSQMITMNTRTQAMFDDGDTYPYLQEGSWIELSELPNFTDPQNLFTDGLDALKTFSLGTIDTASADVLDAWRLTSTGEANWLYADWPIPVDLSYSDAGLVDAARGFPVGDVNWFPAQKAAWLAQRADELADIEATLQAGTIVDGIEEASIPATYKLAQNYPNPFNPTTTIKYELGVSGLVTVKVYNALGKEITTLVNGVQPSGQHEVVFNGNNLASGVYYVTLASKDFTSTKKMVLLK